MKRLKQFVAKSTEDANDASAQAEVAADVPALSDTSGMVAEASAPSAVHAEVVADVPTVLDGSEVVAQVVADGSATNAAEGEAIANMPPSPEQSATEPMDADVEVTSASRITQDIT